MTMRMSLNPKDNIEKLNASRKERGGGGGGGFATIEDCVEASIQGLKDYITKIKERLFTTAKNSTDNISSKRKRKKIR